MYPYSDTEVLSDTDSDSDRSYASGDPRAYYWLHSDYDYGATSRRHRARHDDDESQSEGPDPQDVEEDHALWAMQRDELRDLRAQVRGLLAQDARREHLLNARNDELQETRALNVNLGVTNKTMVQRIAELSTFMCERWVHHAGAQLRARRLSHMTRLLGWIILVLLIVIVPLVHRP